MPSFGAVLASEQADSCCLHDTVLLSMARLIMGLHVCRMPPLHHVLVLMLAPACTSKRAADHVEADWPATLPLAHGR